MKPVKGKMQAKNLYGYRLNCFTAADFARKRFSTAIEVVPSPPLP